MVEDHTNLNTVYGAKTSAEARAAYDGWAGEYDAENISNGYRVPQMGCAMLARHVAPGAGAMLDAGCGTGIVGEMLNVLGYNDISGVDLSPAMLAAAQKLGVYKSLTEHDLGNPLPVPDDTYAAVTCFGSLGPGHAPASCLAEFARVTRPGGFVVINVRSETYQTQPHKAQVDEMIANGVWKLVDQSQIFQVYYLSEPDVTAQVLVFEVC